MFPCLTEQPQPRSVPINCSKAATGLSGTALSSTWHLCWSGLSRTRLTLSQEQSYKTLLSVIFRSIIPEGNHITGGINKENRAGGRKRAVQKHTHTNPSLLNSSCKKSQPFELSL